MKPLLGQEKTKTTRSVAIYQSQDCVSNQNRSRQDLILRYIHSQYPLMLEALQIRQLFWAVCQFALAFNCVLTRILN